MSKAKRATSTPGIVGYVRVSTDEQATSGLGLAAQRHAIEQESIRRDLPIIAIHEDAGISGKNLNRPGLTAALASLESGDGTVLVVSKLDRLSRSVHDATGLMERATRNRWGLVALDLAIDTTSPSGAAMTQLLAVFAELERRLIGERTKIALAAKKANGATLGRPRMIDPGIVSRIRGEHEAGTSWSAIARRLNADAVPTAQGGTAWWPATVRLMAKRDD